MSPVNQKGPLPLILAVTGHRDLRPQDEAPLKERLRAIFTELQEKYRHTQVELFTGLAEGADRLAARVALDSAFTLVAVLPMEKSLYETEFTSVESQQEFDDLLGKASRVVTIPLVEGNEPETVRHGGPARDLQYAALGEYMVAQSQILIALWDGIDTKFPGGTAYIVRAQLGRRVDGGDIDPDEPLDLPETGPVYQIITPRAQNPDIPANPYLLKKHYHRDTEADKESDPYDRIFARMDQFNRDVLDHGGQLAAARAQAREWLLPADQCAALSPGLNQLIDYYALADALAGRYRHWTGVALIIIYACGLAAVCLFELFGHGPIDFRVDCLIAYVALVVLTYAAYLIVRPGRYKTKHLDYRALAESLRLQIFWTLAGLKEQVADHYLRKQRTELAWIRNAIRVWSAGLHGEPGAPAFDLVETYWVNDQFKFFDKVAERDRKRHESRERQTFWIIVATQVIAILTSLVSCNPRHPPPALLSNLPWDFLRSEEVRAATVIGMAMLTAAAGAIAAHALKMAFQEQQKQYQRMRNLFSRGSECLKRALADHDDKLAFKTIFELGKEALEENGDWVLLHRERAVEIHIAG